MSGAPDHDRAKLRPYLILADEAGGYRLVARETRFNSQNYPVVTTTTLAEGFKSTAAARSYAKAHFGAISGEFAMK